MTMLRLALLKLQLERVPRKNSLLPQSFCKVVAVTVVMVGRHTLGKARVRIRIR